MCLLIAALEGRDIPQEHLYNAANRNPDGFGFAIATTGGLETYHSLDIGDTVAAWAVMRERFPGGAALFHLRLATHGTRGIDNAHPFHLGEDPATVIAHNGILPVIQHKDDLRSDTRAFAEDIVPQHGGIESLLFQREDWAQWMGAANKVAALTVNRNLPPLLILNEHRGEWLDGVWYSNQSYEEWKLPPYVGYSFRGFGAREWLAERGQLRELVGVEGDFCETCDSWLTAEALRTMRCDFCDGCLICGDDWLSCKCFDDLNDRRALPAAGQSSHAITDAEWTAMEAKADREVLALMDAAREGAA